MLISLHIVDNPYLKMYSTPPKQGTLADTASHRLAQSIVTGELKQGQKLNEAELRHLEGMRLVKRVPNAGARVVVLDRATMGDLYAVREALEGMACRLAAIHMTDEEIAQLGALLDRHAQDIEQQNGMVYAQSEGDRDFHYQILRGSRNAMLMDLLGSEQYQLLRMCRNQTCRNAQRTRPALQQHRQIVEALAQRDGELAEILMRRHIQGAWQSISEMIDNEEAT
jgi:DNA-binding GntR family transcriptional regulator